MKKALTLLALAILGTIGAYAQLTVSAEYRPRAEYRHGYKTLAATDQENAFFISQRTRLNIMFNTTKLKTKFSLQDIRTWGSQPQLVVADGLTSIHEAWGELLFTDAISLKVGRQEVIYDDHRIFGSVGWAQQARSHDLAILKYEKGFKLHLGLGWNQEKEQLNTNYYTVNNYKTIQYLWFNKKFGRYALSLLFLNNGREHITLGKSPRQINYSQTIGQRSVYKTDKFSAALNLYLQTGKDPADNDLSAFNTRIDLGYKINSKFGISGGYEYLSGNDMVDPDSKNKAFTPLYGTNHKFNGWMDYFYVGNHANSVGLQDIFVALTYSVKNWKVQLHNHYFLSAAPIKDPVKLDEASSGLGNEIDMSVNYKFSEYVNISAGYSHMIASESMGFIKTGDYEETNNWAWLMISIKPTLFKWSK
jgi:hypothetical protein